MQTMLLLVALSLQDAESVKLLRDKGVKVTETKGIATSAEVGDCSKWTDDDFKLLAKLTKLKDLYQQGEFASEQMVTLVGPRQRIIPNVRILGPERKFTQIELSYTDGVYLGLDLPLRVSGDIEGTPGITVLGPRGALHLSKGVIRAARHVHMSSEDMNYYGVKDGDQMKLRIAGPCGVTFDNLRVRYHPKVILEVHIDTDEGNACDLDSATHMELFK